jgi:site-specific DNA recombinase
MNKKGIIYTRVSTEEQKNKGTSIERQLEDCRVYISRNQMEAVAEITDDFSGGTLERPGFLQLRALLAEGKANAVVVFRQDRLSRDSADYMYLRKQ